MSWRDQLRKASFRGVEFGVQTRDQAGGRRVSVEDLPRGETPITEDMGSIAGSLRIRAFLVGSDYLERAAVLTEALGRKGPGRLVDPWVGEKWMHCVQWNRTERQDRGGYCEVQMFLQESGTIREQGEAARSPVGEMDESAEAMSQAGEDAATDGLQVAGASEFARDPIAEAARTVGGLLKPLEVFSDLAADAAAQADRVNNLIATASTLATAPADFASALRVAIDSLSGTFTNALGALFAYETIFGVSTTATGGSSSQSKQADRNGEIAAGLARQLAVAGAARAAVRVEWAARSDAVDARDRILLEIDSEADLAEDGAYLALQDLRAKVVDLVPPPDQDLPWVGTVTLQRSVPSTVLAYQEYGDIEREAEIAGRNKVGHPGFMPPGVPLEVLQYG